jgi:hypothetical protein
MYSGTGPTCHCCMIYGEGPQRQRKTSMKSNGMTADGNNDSTLELDDQNTRCRDEKDDGVTVAAMNLWC